MRRRMGEVGGGEGDGLAESVDASGDDGLVSAMIASFSAKSFSNALRWGRSVVFAASVWIGLGDGVVLGGGELVVVCVV